MLVKNRRLLLYLVLFLLCMGGKVGNSPVRADFSTDSRAENISQVTPTPTAMPCESTTVPLSLESSPPHTPVEENYPYYLTFVADASSDSSSIPYDYQSSCIGQYS